MFLFYSLVIQTVYLTGHILSRNSRYMHYQVLSTCNNSNAHCVSFVFFNVLHSTLIQNCLENIKSSKFVLNVMEKYSRIIENKHS